MTSAEKFGMKLRRLLDCLDAFVESERRSSKLRTAPHEARQVAELAGFSADLRAAVEAGALKSEMQSLAQDIKERLTWFWMCESKGGGIAGKISLVDECMDLIFIFQEAEYANIQ